MCLFSHRAEVNMDNKAKSWFKVLFQGYLQKCRGLRGNQGIPSKESVHRNKAYRGYIHSRTCTLFIPFPTSALLHLFRKWRDTKERKWGMMEGKDRRDKKVRQRKDWWRDEMKGERDGNDGAANCWETHQSPVYSQVSEEHRTCEEITRDQVI